MNRACTPTAIATRGVVENPGRVASRKKAQVSGIKMRSITLVTLSSQTLSFQSSKRNMASFKWPIVTQRVLMKSNCIIRLLWMDGYSLKHQKRKNNVIPPLISCAKASTVFIVLCAILLWTKVWIILVELPFLRCLIPFLYESFIFIDRKFKD